MYPKISDLGLNKLKHSKLWNGYYIPYFPFEIFSNSKIISTSCGHPIHMGIHFMWVINPCVHPLHVGIHSMWASTKEGIPFLWAINSSTSCGHPSKRASPSCGHIYLFIYLFIWEISNNLAHVNVSSLSKSQSSLCQTAAIK